MRLSFRQTLLLSAMLSAGTFPLSAGPPFQTDDPEPVPQYHGEIYFASQITQSAEGVTGTVPHCEINYGILPETQLHLIVPVAVNAPTNENLAFGLGDVEIGVKYRCIKENDRCPQIGVFPLVEYPAGSVSRGLGAGYWQVFLPLWVQKSWGPWTTYGGGGYWVHLKKEVDNSWFFGWLLQRDISKMVTAGVELFTNTPVPETEAGFDAGIIIKLTNADQLLVSIGSDITGDNKLLAYAAYVFTFGPD